MVKINVTPQEMSKILNKSRSSNEQTEEVKEHLEYYNADHKQLRHEICEKIRKSFDEHRKILQSNYDECIFSMDDIIEELEELDQIERGDE